MATASASNTPATRVHASAGGDPAPSTRRVGGTCIISPNGEIIAEAKTRGEELICADCDLDIAEDLKNNLLNFEEHRKIEFYGLIADQRGVVEPD